MRCITLNVVRFTISQSFDFPSSIVHEGEGEREGTASSSLSQSRQRLLLIRRIHSLLRLVGPVWISKTLARWDSVILFVSWVPWYLIESYKICLSRPLVCVLCFRPNSLKGWTWTWCGLTELRLDHFSSCNTESFYTSDALLMRVNDTSTGWWKWNSIEDGSRSTWHPWWPEQQGCPCNCIRWIPLHTEVLHELMQPMEKFQQVEPT